MSVIDRPWAPSQFLGDGGRIPLSSSQARSLPGRFAPDGCTRRAPGRILERTGPTVAEAGEGAEVLCSIVEIGIGIYSNCQHAAPGHAPCHVPTRGKLPPPALGSLDGIICLDMLIER